LNVCEVFMALPLAAEPDGAALLVDGVRVGDVEEGVHGIAWPFVVGVAIRELSHPARDRGWGQASEWAVRQHAIGVRATAPGVRLAPP
jgi:hypothetical protein